MSRLILWIWVGRAIEAKVFRRISYGGLYAGPRPGQPLRVSYSAVVIFSLPTLFYLFFAPGLGFTSSGFTPCNMTLLTVC